MEVPDEGVRLRGIEDRYGRFVGVLIAYPDERARDLAVQGWNAYLVAVEARAGAGQGRRAWIGPDDVRAATFFDPVDVAPCSGGTSEGEPSAGTPNDLFIGEYMRLQTFLPVGTPWFGFEGGGSLLGKTEAEVRARVRGLYWEDERPHQAGIRLPPLEERRYPEFVSLYFGPGRRVGLFTVEFETHHYEAVEQRLESKWGPFEKTRWNHRASADRRVEIENRGTSYRVHVRDIVNCPIDTGDWLQRMEAGWIAARRAGGADYTVQGTAWNHSGSLVRERVRGASCMDRYWELRREKFECHPETTKAKLWGQDCCDPRQCGADARVWVMRMSTALTFGDLDGLRWLIGDGRSLRVSDVFGPTTRRWTLTPRSVSASVAKGLPVWHPVADGDIECEVQSDGRFKCPYGVPASWVELYWEQAQGRLFLDEIKMGGH